MDYINRLKMVANNEVEFKKMLFLIKEEMQNNNDEYKEISLMIRGLRKYCDDRARESYAKSDNVIMLEIDDFCMFILDRMLHIMKERREIEERAIANQLRVSTLPKDLRDAIRLNLVNDVYQVMEVGFADATKYQFEKLKSLDAILYATCIVGDLKYDIVKELIGIEPCVFIAEKGSHEANVSKLAIILITINPGELKFNGEQLIDESMVYLTNTLSRVLNNVVESCMSILLEDILTDYDKVKISEDHNIEESSMKYEIGKEVASILSGECDVKKCSDLLKDVIKISKDRQTEEYKIKRVMMDKMRSLNRKFSRRS